MVGHFTGSNNQPYRGDFHLSEEVYTSMKDRAAERPRTEVGGMLFGMFEKEDGRVVNVRVERVVNVPDNQGVHQATYFSINDSFMSDVVDEYIPPYTYLGNWHSHLGYGGPSSGDHKQVSKFFEENPERDYLIAVIQDRDGGIRDLEYDTYIELYERKRDNSTDYHIHQITDVDTIEHPPERTVDDESEGGSATEVDLLERIEAEISAVASDNELASDMSELASELVTELDVVEEDGVGTVYQNSREEPETILLVPVQLRTERDDPESTSKIEQAMDEVSRSLHVTSDTSPDSLEHAGPLATFLSISIPGSYPEGDIYIDVKSRDQTVQATIMQISCVELSASPQEFCNQIQAMLDEEIDEFLAQSVDQLLATRGGDDR